MDNINIGPSTSLSTYEPKILNRSPLKIRASKTSEVASPIHNDLNENSLSQLHISPLPLTQATQHREPIPNKTNELTNVMIMSNPPTKNSKVFVTSVLNEHTLFIRHADPKSNAEYQKILNEVAVNAVHAPALNKTPVKGDFVLAAFDGELSRALVLRVEPGNTLWNIFARIVTTK